VDFWYHHQNEPINLMMKIFAIGSIILCSVVIIYATGIYIESKNFLIKKKKEKKDIRL